MDKNTKRVILRDNIGISPSTLARLSKDQTVQMGVLGKICKELRCNIGDIDDTSGGIK